MKHLITLICLLLPLAIQAQIIDTDFNIGGKAVTVLDRNGDYHELIDGCTFTIQHQVFGSAGTITQIKIVTSTGETVYNELLTDKQAVYLPKNGDTPYAIAIIGDYFVHALVFPDTGLISLKTQPYKQ